MKKIGILTEYYKNYNYGGVLQAYALCKVIQKMGFECEQIQYSKKANMEKVKFSSSGIIRYTADIIKNIVMNVVYRERKKKFDYFMTNEIKHSKAVYTDETIVDSSRDYDIFVVGSDQVWNPNLFNKAYYLEFVPEDKVKLSYAASLSVSELTEKQKKFFEESLVGYKAISVREKNAVALLQTLTNTDVRWVLDPTLLLTKNEWEKVGSGRKVSEKYVFTYFLGNGSEERRLAIEYARENHLKILAMPLVFGWKTGFDNAFGDIRLFDVSPKDFISLIQNAEVVFTDSFHAVVFAHIFEKNFFAFKRNDHVEMAARLYSITELFDTKNHFCDTAEKLTLDYLQSNNELVIDRTLYEKNKEQSLDFLLNNIR